MKKRTLCLSLLILAGAAFFAACGKRPDGAETTRAVPVTLVDVQKKEFARPIHTYGRLCAKKEIKLSFKTGGVIREIRADEGQEASKGQLLARLDLAEVAAQASMARSGLEKAKRDLERIKKLFADKAATLEQYQDAQTAFQVAESRCRTAEFNLRLSEIRAPAQGRILKRMMEENEMIGPGTPVFLFGSTEQDWVVRAGISDRELLRLKLGDRARVGFDPYPGETFPASVSEIAEAPDPHTGSYEVELTVEKKGRPLLAGMVARIDLAPSDREPLFLIPVQSLVSAAQGHGVVYTVDRPENTARKIVVAVAFLFADQVAVRSGLEGIERVIAAGASYVTDGAPVEVIEPSALPGGGK
ncbi:MAG: efflux RND transporter periplasmic adaptor subunit [Candidatus Aminicenantes bacterium]|nr:efflux RND transporter periplasmic adaptor subunit [Candidatus Aminicenantes bacterium]